MALVYRVENADGDGLYHGAVWPKRWSNSGSKASRHPHPRYDAGLKKALGNWDDWAQGGHYEKLRFAFATLAQLKSWLYRDTWRAEFEAGGYHVAVFEVPESAYVYGDTQAIFDLARATRIDTLKLTEV